MHSNTHCNLCNDGFGVIIFVCQQHQLKTMISIGAFEETWLYSNSFFVTR